MNRRGVLLVSVLFFVLVVGMIARAILIAGPGMARVGTQANQELLAQRAAEAGAAYARSQLRENADWKGDANALTVDLADLKIREDQGNVLGWMQNSRGHVAMFRIRFNYQDGGAGPDGLPNPAAAHFVDHPYVSINNVRSSAQVLVPQADAGGNWPVTTIPSAPHHNIAPPRTALVAIEGLAGRAVADANGPSSPLGPGPVVKRVLRVVLAASASPSIPKDAISAGNGLEIQMSAGANVSVVGTDEAKLRSKKEVTMVDVDAADPNDDILTMDGTIGRDATAGGVTAVLNGTITEEDEYVGDGNDFHNLPWSEVPLASDNPTEAVQIPGGVYVAKIDGTYAYFDMTADDFKTAAKGADGLPTTGGVNLDSQWSQVRTAANMSVNGLNYDDAQFTLTIDRDLRVNPSTNGINDIVITNAMGRTMHEDEIGSGKFEFGPPTLYAPGTLELNDATISTVAETDDPGDLAILINVKGDNGSITAEGDAVVAAPSVTLEASGATAFQQLLSVYAKRELTVSTFIDSPGFFAPPYVNVPPYQGYGPLRLEGLIYAMGDANVYAGTPGKPHGPGQFGQPTNYGEVVIQGALVAYGGDPALFDAANPSGNGPGSNTNAGETGRVSLFGESADIIYDPAKLGQTAQSIPPNGPLDGLVRVSYGFEN